MCFLQQACILYCVYYSFLRFLREESRTLCVDHSSAQATTASVRDGVASPWSAFSPFPWRNSASKSPHKVPSQRAHGRDHLSKSGIDEPAQNATRRSHFLNNTRTHSIGMDQWFETLEPPGANAYYQDVDDQGGALPLHVVPNRKNSVSYNVSRYAVSKRDKQGRYASFDEVPSDSMDSTRSLNRLVLGLYESVVK